MPSFNKVVLLGNVCRDPDLRYTAKGTALAEFSLAMNRSWTDEAGTRREETTFVEVTVWGRLAEIAKQYLRKGSPAFIEGRLTLDTWEDKQSGQKRSKLRVVAENLQLLGQRSEFPASPSEGRIAQPSASQARPAKPPIPEPDIEPF